VTICQYCKRPHPVRKDGLLIAHRNHRVPCEGTHQLPCDHPANRRRIDSTSISQRAAELTSTIVSSTRTEVCTACDTQIVSDTKTWPTQVPSTVHGYSTSSPERLAKWVDDGIDNTGERGGPQ